MKKIEKATQNAENQHLPDALNGTKKHKTSFFELLKKHSTLFVLITGALLMLIIYFGKEFENEKEKERIILLATNQLDVTNQEMLRLLAKPLVWSVRADMLRGNTEQIDLLILNLIKEKNFQFIHLIEPNGNVILSTNKGLEGKFIGDNVDAVLLRVSSDVLVVEINHSIYVSAPIFGIDQQIATLIIGYKPVGMNFEN